MITAGGIKETGILMSPPMVLVTLSDDKTQTRRALALHNAEVSRSLWESLDWSRAFVDPGLGDGAYLKVGGPDDTTHRVRCKWKVGERLWVRERCWIFGRWIAGGIAKSGRSRWRFDVHPHHRVKYERPLDHELTYWGSEYEGYAARPSIHMPRWASRILLEITGVRPERLQLITEADCIAEGMVYNDRGRDAQSPSAHEQYYALWNSLNDDRGYSWEKNPWVWVISFRRIAA